jgi:hypothetical protein
MGIVSGFMVSTSVADGIVGAFKKQYRVEYANRSIVKILFPTISTAIRGDLVLIPTHLSI